MRPSILISPATPSARVVLSNGDAAPKGVKLICRRKGCGYGFTLANASSVDLRIREVVLFDGPHGLPPGARLHGEGYNKISQTAGTLAEPEDVDAFTDRGHYRLPQPAGFRTVYGMMSAAPPGGPFLALGFSSCRRFVGKFNVNAERLQIVMQTEDVRLRAGETWELEELLVLSGKNRNALLRRLAGRICENHPRLPHPERPTGWCSWYCYGPDITPALIRENLLALKARAPYVRYVQIDDGYQPWMGDWLAPSARFPKGVKKLLREIRALGFEPAIWLAPFIASPESELFRSHPDWFVQSEDGRPLRSDSVTFGGWRQGPWYMLDGTHPGARNYLETVFRTMREEWGCSYFKLDANIWGALPFGRRYDRDATSVEAYRRGMAAARRGAGRAFLLGCNHPLWPSLGEIHGSRCSMDIARDWNMIKRVARENLLRNWQNDRLWWNDPDCLLLDAPKLSADELSFHITATCASGGMLLSGDAVVNYSDSDWQCLQTMAARRNGTGQAAEFEDENLALGWMRAGKDTLAVVLNWSDKPESRTIPLRRRARVSDFRTGAALGTHEKAFCLACLPPHSGRLLRLAAET